mgnify:CR=1 FL=1
MYCALDFFKENTMRFPKSSNAWDSLGEAYLLDNQKEKALKNYQKALSLNPNARVKASAEKGLKELTS